MEHGCEIASRVLGHGGPDQVADKGMDRFQYGTKSPHATSATPPESRRLVGMGSTTGRQTVDRERSGTAHMSSAASYLERLGGTMVTDIVTAYYHVNKVQ